MPPQQSSENAPTMPSRKQQSFGAVVAIVVILAMIVIGAFYSWGKRLEAERALLQHAASSTQP